MQMVRGNVESGELPSNWLRKYLLATILIPLDIILIGVILLTAFRSVSNVLFILWIFGGSGVLVMIYLTLAHADETPLMKYSLIRKISSFLRKMVEHIPSGF